MGPTGSTRAVQIHPTRRCNLSCLHCYSSSSPQAAEAIDFRVLRNALDDLAEEGYTWASFSGGEPMVYAPLPSVLAHTKQVGLNTAIVSNGMLLTPKRLDAIMDTTDLLVISLDGKPESHNRMRNSPKAFDAMAEKLPRLRERQINFGFLFTLTQHNLDELPWVVEFAVNAGAKLLQIHPLEYFGNATTQLSGKAPDAVEGAYAWLLAEKFKELVADRMALQVDLVHTDALHQQPDSFFLNDTDDELYGPLGELMSPLVIEPDGEVLPLQYGFSRAYSLGNLAVQRIQDMAVGWRQELGPKFHALCRQLFASISDTGQGRFFNWYEQIAVEAEQQAQGSAKILPFPAIGERRRPAV